MNINANKFAISTALTFSIFWVVCSLVVMQMPGLSMQASGYMVHSNMANLEWEMSFSGIFYGLLLWSVISGVTAWLLATIYNKLL